MDNIFTNYQIKRPKIKTSKRAEFISQIFDIYSSEAQRLFRKKENWKRYCNWARENKLADNKENQTKFKKTKLFIKEHSLKTICYFIAPIPTSSLDYIVSVAKDMQNRNQNFSGYLMGNLFLKGDNSKVLKENSKLAI